MSTEFSTTKLLVKNILEKAEHYKWSLQGLGMLRLYLSDELRLHVWDSRYKMENVSPLHDHPWSFDSDVIAGQVDQFRYTLSDKDTQHAQKFKFATIKCGENACTVSDPEIAYLLPHFETFNEGESYTQHKDEIHESIPTDGTVTLVHRTFHPDREHARVFWRGDGGFVSAEPRPAAKEEVKAITEYALRRWFF
jgi:hypothetical protein